MSEATQQRLAAKWQSSVTQADLERWERMTYDQSNQDIKRQVEATHREGKRAVVQEHAAMCVKPDVALEHLRGTAESSEELLRSKSPLVVSEELLHDCTPIILFRHPALAIPSLYRLQLLEGVLDVNDEAFHLWVTLFWLRLVYELFHQQSKAPIIIDAADLVHNTDNKIGKVCSKIDLDPKGISLKWEQMEDDRLPQGVVPSFEARIRNSIEIEHGNNKVSDADIDVDAMANQWEEEFGTATARTLRKLVQAEMPTYWYLRSKRIGQLHMQTFDASWIESGIQRE